MDTKYNFKRSDITFGKHVDNFKYFDDIIEFFSIEESQCSLCGNINYNMLNKECTSCTDLWLHQEKYEQLINNAIDMCKKNTKDGNIEYIIDKKEYLENRRNELHNTEGETKSVDIVYAEIKYMLLFRTLILIFKKKKVNIIVNLIFCCNFMTMFYYNKIDNINYLEHTIINDDDSGFILCFNIENNVAPTQDTTLYKNRNKLQMHYIWKSNYCNSHTFLDNSKKYKKNDNCTYTFLCLDNTIYKLDMDLVKDCVHKLREGLFEYFGNPLSNIFKCTINRSKKKYKFITKNLSCNKNINSEEIIFEDHYPYTIYRDHGSANDELFLDELFSYINKYMSTKTIKCSKCKAITICNMKSYCLKCVPSNIVEVFDIRKEYNDIIYKYELNYDQAVQVFISVQSALEKNNIIYTDDPIYGEYCRIKKTIQNNLLNSVLIFIKTTYFKSKTSINQRHVIKYYIESTKRLKMDWNFYLLSTMIENGFNKKYDFKYFKSEKKICGLKRCDFWSSFNDKNKTQCYYELDDDSHDLPKTIASDKIKTDFLKSKNLKLIRMDIRKIRKNNIDIYDYFMKQYAKFEIEFALFYETI
jgi:hypothetical protein